MHQIKHLASRAISAVTGTIGSLTVTENLDASQAQTTGLGVDGTYQAPLYQDTVTLATGSNPAAEFAISDEQYTALVGVNAEAADFTGDWDIISWPLVNDQGSTVWHAEWRNDPGQDIDIQLTISRAI